MQFKISEEQLKHLYDTYKNKYVGDEMLYTVDNSFYDNNEDLKDRGIKDLYSKYDEIAERFNDIFRKQGVIGRGEDGSAIRLYTLKYGRKKKPVILIVGGVHGNEKTSCYGIYYSISEILHNMDAEWANFLVNNFEIQIIPCMNVYGFNENTRYNANHKDLNRDFNKKSQEETKCVTEYILKNQNRIAIILDSHNAHNEEYLTCKEKMKHYKEYEDVCMRLNLLMNDDPFEVTEKHTNLFMLKSQNNATFSDFINKNGFWGHTVESPRSVENVIDGSDLENLSSFVDGTAVTKQLLINLMVLYGTLYKKSLNEGRFDNVIQRLLRENLL